MPLVTLTPRVRVSRMCTSSRMPLAASVRRIWSVISSSVGISRERQRVRGAAQPGEVLVERKMRPSYSRRPSHTASPPCTAESNGLTAGLVAVGRAAPPTLTTRSRLRSSNVCCTAAPSVESSAEAQPVGGQRVVVGPAPREQRLEPVRAGARRRPRSRVEAGRGLHAGVPVRRPDAVGRVRPAGQDSIAAVERRRRARAQSARSTASGSVSTSRASTTGPPYRW